MGRHAVAVGWLLLLAVHALAQAPVPIGPEIEVDPSQQFIVGRPFVAADGSGRFVVVWESRNNDDGDLYGVFGQRFDASGARLGTEFPVNAYTTGYQVAGDVASDAAGGFVVVWTSYQYGVQGVFGRRYDAMGAPGPEFRVSTGTTGNIHTPDVAMDGLGNFVVVWKRNYEIFGQRYDSNGVAQGTEFQVNTYTTGAQEYPSVDMDGAGNFIVVWSSNDGSPLSQVLGQRFNSAGTPVGGELAVSIPTGTHRLGSMSVAMAPDGRFVVAWTDVYPGCCFPNNVVARRFDAAGMAVGSEFTVNSSTTYVQRDPAVSSDAAGNFVVVWQSERGDGHSYGVFGQAFDASGVPAGGEFQVNTYTRNDQYAATIAASGAGTFVIAWSSGFVIDDFVTFGEDIFAQRLLADLIFRNGFEQP
jgi:hypothetical protein